MKLIYEDTEKEVQKGDILTDFRGDKAIADYWKEPTHGTGKISVKKNPEDKLCCGEYYVNVFGLKFVN